MKILEEILAFNSGLGCTPQEGYRDLNDALSDTKRLSIEGAEKQKGAEVLAACLAKIRERYMRLPGFDDASPEFFDLIKEIEQLQPASSALEEYVKNLPLSEIARIKGIPGIAKLGKTYDRPDFTCREDE